MTVAPKPEAAVARPVGDLDDSPRAVDRALALTVDETVRDLHRALRDYIEATYHLSHPALVRERAALLNDPGVIAQRPFFESTPRYRKTRRFREISGLHPEVMQLFESLSKRGSGGNAGLKRILFDPPYEHQALAVETALVGRKGQSGAARSDLVVM